MNSGPVSLKLFQRVWDGDESIAGEESVPNPTRQEFNATVSDLLLRLGPDMIAHQLLVNVGPIGKTVLIVGGDVRGLARRAWVLYAQEAYGIYLPELGRIAVRTSDGAEFRIGEPSDHGLLIYPLSPIGQGEMHVADETKFIPQSSQQRAEYEVKP